MDFDFLIIGGGIAGTSVGAALSAFGTVCLWEKETALAYHSSGRSAALFEAQYGLPETIALNAASGAAHHAGGYTSPRGLMFLATEDQRDEMNADIATYGLQPMSPQEAQAIIPILNTDAIAMAGHHAEAWDLDTDRMVQDAAARIRAEGGIVEPGCAVTAILRVSGGWEVASGNHVVTARVLVDAAGAWADRIASMAGITPLGLTPLRRSMARMPAPGGFNVSGWPMVIGAGETWYAKPDAGAWLVSPAEEDPVEPMDAWADDMIIAEGIARYQEMVTEPVTRVTQTWAGLRTFTPDRRLALGPAADDPSFIWVAGQGGYGFQTAPAASGLVASLIAGITPSLPNDIVKALDPGRFL